MSDPVPSRGSLVLAIAVVAQPVLIAVNTLLHPPVELSGHGLLHGTAESPGTWSAVHLSAAVGALLLVPAAVGLRSLVGGRIQRLATAGVAVSVVAALALAVSFIAEASVLRLAATAPIDDDAAVALADAFVATPEFALIPVGFLAAVVSSLLLGAALLVARSVPRWLVLGHLVGVLTGIVAPPGTPIGPVAGVLLVGTGAVLAVRVRQGTASVEAAAARRDEPQPDPAGGLVR
ncbi:hypothetical protein OF117_12650 [Geodermatophilus sp. YIM 151500]|uniref:hypothetical protein n=1 Tax=Geodermatophilus sp. YIM 151500 TaxID=2984531 RepID=UPI0021E50665|nr:hypothetical protein [Geodermatophilus sp. YIM 151500]MCV2490214.1 hypothetical protein [Geodermatophilus sp. YIM 151500]